MKPAEIPDAELNYLFAREVAGWKIAESGGGFIVDPADGLIRNAPNYCASADAVFPWLEKGLLWDTQGCRDSNGPKFYITRVMCEGTPRYYVEGRCLPFARSAVLALLRAHGVEVEP